jgi:hypothetical protein
MGMLILLSSSFAAPRLDGAGAGHGDVMISIVAVEVTTVL